MLECAWSDDDVRKLRIFWRLGWVDNKIAPELGFSESQVRTKRSELKLIGNEHSGGQLTYTKEEDRIVETMFEQRLTDREIGDAIGRTGASVGSARQRLGLFKHVNSTQRKRGMTLHELREWVETRFVPLKPNEDAARYREATFAHLYDLKREGHSPTRTELREERSGFEQVRFYHAEIQDRSYCGSPAWTCAG